MTKIEALAEQTTFLFEKQQEVLAFFKAEFGTLYDLLDAEQAKAEQVKAGPELASFQNVREMLMRHEKESIQQLEEDIAFLGEQVKAIKEIQKLESKEEQEEIITMMLEGGEPLPDTNTFKADVEGEAEEAKVNFRAMIDDVKGVLMEEGIQQLEILLEAHVAAMEQEEGEGEDDEGCCEGTEPDCSSCSSCCGKDIFE